MFPRLLILLFGVAVAALVFSKEARRFAWSQLRDHGFRTAAVLVLTLAFAIAVSSTNSGFTFNQ